MRAITENEDANPGEKKLVQDWETVILKLSKFNILWKIRRISEYFFGFLVGGGAQEFEQNHLRAGDLRASTFHGKNKCTCSIYPQIGMCYKKITGM